jgi:cytochrome P450
MTTTPEPPGPRGFPLLGVLPALRRDTLTLLERARREHGDVVRFLAGPPGLRTTTYALFHPDAVRRVLAGRADDYRKENRFYTELRLALGDGLLNSQDERWLRQRRFVQPLFTRRRIAGYAAAMGEEAEALAHGWRAAARTGAQIDVHREMSRLTLRVVGRLLFGADVERAVPVVAASFPVLGEYARNRAYNPASPPRSWPTPANRRAAHAQRAMREVCDALIADRRGAGDGAGADDLIGMLVAARDGAEALDDGEIRDQVLIFLLAGHDTTALALTFALQLLGRHPAARARMQAEVDAALGDRTPGAEDVERLPYTTMVLKEAMRLYPPAWATGRRSATGDEIDGYRLPPGSDVIVSPWVTHRHPGFWDDPARFEPERFTPEGEAARHRHAYFPFGAGPRACIGQYFSMLEAAIVLAVVAREFDVVASLERIPLAPRITLHPAGPVPCRLALRSSRAAPAAARPRVAAG